MRKWCCRSLGKGRYFHKAARITDHIKKNMKLLVYFIIYGPLSIENLHLEGKTSPFGGHIWILIISKALFLLASNHETIGFPVIDPCKCPQGPSHHCPPQIIVHCLPKAYQSYSLRGPHLLTFRPIDSSNLPIHDLQPAALIDKYNRNFSPQASVLIDELEVNVGTMHTNSVG